MAGISDMEVQAVVTGASRGGKEAPTGTPLARLQQKRIFIVACLHQSQEILDRWAWELLRLLLALQPSPDWQHVFVSIYESGSTDSTVAQLNGLREIFNYLGVPNRIETGNLVRGVTNRVEFLAAVRNKAMEPLYSLTDRYDQVLWLNDIIFCADGVLQLLAYQLPIAENGLGSDAVCGMDYGYDGGNCRFYDSWVSHDISGNNFMNDPPIVVEENGRQALMRSSPFQAFTCWNGMVAISADIFQQGQVHFRRAAVENGECAASEVELLLQDMWKMGRGRIAVSPRSASAYRALDFESCALQQQPQSFDSAPAKLQFYGAPLTVSCCPLEPNADFVDFNACFKKPFGG